MQALELLLFYFTYILLFFSVAGYGFSFNNLLKINLSKNFGLIVILGLFFLTLISYLSIFFIPHSYLFNVIIFLIGLTLFIFNLDKIINFKFLILIISIIFIGFIVSKTHDDFAFYHLQQSINFSKSKIQFGLSNLDFSYAKHSSLLYLNSNFYLPYFKYYFFNAPNQFFLTAIIITLSIFVYDKKNEKFLRYFALFSLSYILLKFTRSSEYGTDIIGQLLIILFIYLTILFFLTNNVLLKKEILVISGLICVFCFTLKTYFIFYALIYFYLILSLNIKFIINFIVEKYFYFVFIFMILFSYFSLNLISSGCLIYPIASLCFDDLIWSMPSQEVLEYKIWYETWAKSIAGAGYVIENSENLIKKFYWIPFWFKNYFFGRFLDNLVLIVFLSVIFLVLFREKEKIYQTFNQHVWIVYLIINLILIFWFLKHPSLRYGGYAPFFLIFLIPLSYNLSKFYFDEKKFIRNFKIIFCITLLFFSSKNILRINSEFKRNDMYKFTNFPYFSVPEVKYRKVLLNNDTYVFQPIESSCWDTPPPCPFSENVFVMKKFNYTIFYKKK